MKKSLSTLRQLIKEYISESIDLKVDGQNVPNVEEFLLKQLKQGSSFDWEFSPKLSADSGPSFGSGPQDRKSGFSVFKAVVDDDELNGITYYVRVNSPKIDSLRDNTFTKHSLSLTVSYGSNERREEKTIFNQEVTAAMLPQLMRRIDALFSQAMKGKKFSGK